MTEVHSSRVNDSSLTPAQKAAARHHTYVLLGRLFLQGLHESLWQHVQAIPDLAAHLPHSYSPDTAAADYQELFGFNLFPYESIFLGTDRLLGGRTTGAVMASYRQMGFQVDERAAGPDHVGHELALLAFLSGAEADAWRDGVTAEARRMRQLAADFMQRHLLRWLFPFVVAVDRQANPFYTALAGLTLDFVAAHAEELQEVFTFAEELVLPAAPALATSGEATWRPLAAYLLTPAWSGVYLSRNDISRLARSYRLPRGFGEREQMLVNLLKAADVYDSFDALMGTLQELVTAWEQRYRQQMHTFPQLAPFAQTWRSRALDTAQKLTLFTPP